MKLHMYVVMVLQQASAIDSKDSLHPKQLNTFEAPYEAPYVRSYGAPTGVRNRF
jgi:hypothetical protein